MDLSTERLWFDGLRESDAKALFAYRADPEVSRYQGWRPETLDEAKGFIRNQSGFIEPSPDEWFQRAIRRIDDGTLIGDLGIRLSDDKQAEFGITLAPSAQGQGFAREALGGLLRELFGRLGVHRVHASVDPRNAASMALLTAVGMRQEAHFRESLRFRGEWVDDVVFAMLAQEWHEAQAKGAGFAASR
jgi:RimJ/RimL family protein N-acetyltransferase